MSSLATINLAHKQAMCAASILRHEHLVRVRRHEIEPEKRDRLLADDPRALDAVIELTRDNVKTLEIEIARELAAAQALDPDIAHETTGHRRMLDLGAAAEAKADIVTTQE